MGQEILLLPDTLITCPVRRVEQLAKRVLVRAGVAGIEFRMMPGDNDERQVCRVAEGILADLVKGGTFETFDKIAAVGFLVSS